jgi:hypothetical protein
MNQKEIKNHMNATNIEELCNEDLIFVNIFGKSKKVKVLLTGDNCYDESGNYKYDKFKLNKKEIDVLKWLLKNVDIDNYKKQILDYCNNEYSDKKINLEDITNEVNINTIVINVTKKWKAKDGTIYPEIAFLGDCKCDEEHGICIGFRDEKYIGIKSQDWIL